MEPSRVFSAHPDPWGLTVYPSDTGDGGSDEEDRAGARSRGTSEGRQDGLQNPLWAKLRGAWVSKKGCEMDAGIKCQNQPAKQGSSAEPGCSSLPRMSMRQCWDEGFQESWQKPERGMDRNHSPTSPAPDNQPCSGC